MIDKIGAPGSGTLRAIKVVLALMAVVFLVAQFHYLFKPGGIIAVYGLAGGFSAFGDVSLRDPITAAGFIDLVTIMVTLIIVLACAVPLHRGRGFVVALLLLILCVYPALALIIFLLVYWRRLGQFRPQ